MHEETMTLVIFRSYSLSFGMKNVKAYVLFKIVFIVTIIMKI